MDEDLFLSFEIPVASPLSDCSSIACDPSAAYINNYVYSVVEPPINYCSVWSDRFHSDSARIGFLFVLDLVWKQQHKHSKNDTYIIN